MQHGHNAEHSHLVAPVQQMQDFFGTTVQGPNVY